MTDTSTTDTGPFPVFSANGTMQGNLTSIQGQPPAAAPEAPPAAPGASALAPQSPLSVLGRPPQPTAGPPPDMNINFPPQRQVPQTQKIGPAPDAQDYHKNALAFASAMAVLGAVSSKFTRMSGTASLSAFAGALKGWQEGNLQAYDQASKKWEQDTKATIENNKQILEDYKLTLENDQLNIDEQMAEYRLKSIKWHDQMSYDAATQNNFTFLGKVFDKNWEYTYGEKGIEATTAPLMKENALIAEKLKLTAAQVISGQIDPNGIDPKTGQPYTEAQKLNLKYIVENYGPQAGKKVPSAQNLALQRFMEEHPNATGEDIQKFNAAGRPARSAAAMSLQKFLEEHPSATSEDIQAFQAQQAGKSAEERATGQRAGAIAIAADEANKTIPNVRAAAQKSAGKGIATWNAVENKWKIEKGDADFAYYVQQLNSLVNIYGRVISGGGKGTVSDLEHARQMLNPNMPLSAVEGALRGFETEIAIAEKAPGEVRAKMRGGGASSSSETPSGGGTADPLGIR